MELPLSAFYGKVLYQLQYVDYNTNTWTAPVLLTKERADKFLDDASVIKIKLTSASFMPLIPGKPDVKELELDLK